MEIKRKCDEAEIPNALITDAGLTEFHGVPTKTCLGIGPWESEEIDKITGELSLLWQGMNLDKMQQSRVFKL